jgi:hypothetical protein
MSEYPMCDHEWDIPGAKEKRLFCYKCGVHFDYASYVEGRIAELEAELTAIRTLAQAVVDASTKTEVEIACDALAKALGD